MGDSVLTKLLYTLVLACMIGCGSGNSNSGRPTGSVTAQLHWTEGTGSSVISSGKQTAAAPQGVVTVRIVVSGSDMSNVQQDFPASAGLGVIDGVPVGTNRTLTAQGLDSSGVVTHQGVIGNITVQSGQTTDAGIVVMNPAGQTFTVSGRVTLNGSGLAGVTVSLQGTSFTTVTGSDGTYSLPGVPNALYTVVPSLAGYTFAPANRSIPDSNGNVIGQDFTATAIPPQTFTVSGTVTLNGSGLAGVTVSLQGTSLTTATGSDGSYSLTGVLNGSYTAVPSMAGFTFTPANRLVTVSNADVTGQDFAATVQTFTISGNVALNGTGLANVTVLLQGTSSNSTTTDSDGNYTFTGVQNGLYTVTPFLTGYTFTPPNLSVSVNNGDVTGQDFVATVQTSTVSGTWTFLITPQGGTAFPAFVVITQTGNSLSGTVFVTTVQTATSRRSSAFTFEGTLTFTGTINGNNIQITVPGVTNNCDEVVTASLTGTVSADGSSMNGTFTVSGSGDCAVTGTWGATKAQPPASDLSGSWSLFHTPQGGTEQGPDCETITQTGNVLTFSGSLTGFGILSGNSIQIILIKSSQSCVSVNNLVGTIASGGTTMSGNYTTVNQCGTPPESGTWRMAQGTCTLPAPQGTVSGTVTDALGNPLSGVTVELLSGNNVITTTTNNSDGTYSITAPAGSGYSIEFLKSGYITSTASNITITANTTTPNVNAALTAPLPQGQTRIVLTWGPTPPDLDSHLTGPIPDSTSRFHIYYANMGSATSSPFAALDVDATEGFGPETTTIYQQFSGVYRFSVRDFTNGGQGTTSKALSNSGAQVNVYQGNSLVATFNVPTNTGGDLWTVFELNGSTITLINTMTFVSDETTIQSVSGNAGLKKTKTKGTKR